MRRKLEFPDRYFMMPPEERTAAVGIERVTESVYEELHMAVRKATEYEDVQLNTRRGQPAYLSAREQRSKHKREDRANRSARFLHDDGTRSQASYGVRSRGGASASSDPEDSNLTRSSSAG
jgi:hypothetical protein